MRRIEMVPVLEDLECEVAEDACKAVGYPFVVGGVAEAAEREVDRLVEVPQGIEVQLARGERTDEGRESCRS